MKTKIILMLILIILLVGCTPGIQQTDIIYNIERFHDDEINVTCWIYSDYIPDAYAGGLSCIPDWQLTPQPFDQ